MWYWILIFVLAIGCIAMLGVSFASIKRDKEAAARYQTRRNESHRYDDDDDDEYERSGRRRREALSGRKSSEERPDGSDRRRWKIILEDIDSWDKYSFTFYDTVGIGRGKDGSMYEKFLSLPKDGRISKMHCVIIHRGDKLYLKDEGSRNGTYLNGQRIDRPEMLQRDDIIGVGETRLEVQRVLRETL
ncbi:FHA domain-containing protein [Clostridium sp. Marseille-P3244]|uniref:FHA domain-containing protein n=1 Tax=Clostridium sp. Marseille-P3244 TaxID=1871020 RepID=UPI0009305063|nr:FHA domain-containing protein [Clostridium sp. Marseille-P3244]